MMLTLVPIALLAGTVFIAAAGVASLARVGPPLDETVPGHRARVICPVLGEYARVRISPDPGARLHVATCSQFGRGPVTCRQDCFRDLDYPVGAHTRFASA